MGQTITLPRDLYVKLAHGAAGRGLTIEALLAWISELLILPDRPTKRDRERSRRIERLLASYRLGPLTDADRDELNKLIAADYHQARARADRLIAAKKSRRGGLAAIANGKGNGTRRTGRRLRK